LIAITPANVGKLAVAWTYHTDPAYRQSAAGTATRKPASETTSLEVRGVMRMRAKNDVSNAQLIKFRAKPKPQHGTADRYQL
jgi:glucose dehydrogenase